MKAAEALRGGGSRLGQQQMETWWHGRTTGDNQDRTLNIHNISFYLFFIYVFGHL